MRKIKFRIPHYNFNNTFSHFSYWGTIDHKGNFSDDGTFTSPSTSSGTNKKWHEQLTGLKDKHGEEIYENDLMIHPEFPPEKLQITINEGAALIAGWDCIRTDLSKGEIVGNIHENKY